MGKKTENISRALLQRCMEATPSALDRSVTEISRVEVPCDACDMATWLFSHAIPQKVYWRAATGFEEAAGLGVVDTWKIAGHDVDETSLRRLVNRTKRVHPGIRYYGGVAFPGGRGEGAAWKDFGSGRFFVPRMELRRQGKRYTFGMNFLDSENPVAIIEVLTRRIRAMPTVFPLPEPVMRTDLPGLSEWRRACSVVLREIERGSMIKTVLARRVRFDFKKKPDIFSLLCAVAASAGSNNVYFIQFNRSRAFMGASPERLYKRSGRSIETEAVAGTTPRGKSRTEQLRWKKHLLSSPKESREHTCVVDHLVERLDGICSSVERDASASIVPSALIQHLKTRIRGTLRKGIDDAALISLLHPTPATCGLPPEEAAAAISRLEPFSRGWYCGAVGWIARGGADLVVAIRCGLVDKKILDVFAGAGIVSQSDAGREWDETSEKLAAFIDLFRP